MKKLISILIISLLLNGCSNENQELQKNVKVSKNPREVFIFAGKIQTNDSVNLASKISPSKVLKVTVDVGSTVKVGDPIIYLDTTDLQNQKKQAEVKVSTAESALDKVKSKARPEDISIAQAAVDNDEKAYENVQSSYNRIKKLYDSGYSTKQDMEQVEAGVTSAKDKLLSDKENLNKLNNGATKEDINVAQSSINEAQAAVNSAQGQLDNGIITSPISGTVSVSNIHEGEIAQAGANLITIVNNDQLYIDGYVPEDILPKVKVGQEVVVKVSDMPDKRFKGEVSVINPLMNSNSKNVVRVTLKQGNDVLKPGMFAQIAI
jgi:HlyD family secretion protein